MACGYPALLINKGVCGTRCAQTVLDENSFIDSVVPARGMSAKCPLFHSDLGAIGVAQGDRKPKNPPSPQPLSRQGRGAKMDSRFRGNDGICEICWLIKQWWHSHGLLLTLNPCCRACDDLKSWEVLSEDLFDHRDKPRFVWLVRASSAAPNFLKQRRA